MKSAITAPADPFFMREQESSIIVNESYIEGLYRIEENEYITVVFHFHQADGYRLKGPRYDGEVTGVFASRSPFRPGAVGVTTVQLLERKGNELRVKGLDAIHGTPVLDIKPYTPSLDETEREKVKREREIQSPRQEIVRAIRRYDLRDLLLGAGSIHGHFCPGLAMGVIAGAYGMKEFGLSNDGMEELLAIIETNNCFCDGIQFVTGCTIGNNALVYRDYGKTAVTFCRRDGKGLRLAVKSDYREKLNQLVPEFTPLFQKVVTERKGDEADRTEFKKAAAKASFRLLEMPREDIITAATITIAIPEYAPIRESIVCENCHESVMGSKILELEGKRLCRACAARGYGEMNGAGIVCEEMPRKK